MTALVDRLAKRLGPDVCVAMGDETAPLWPEEVSAVERAIPKRQAEFAAGRSAARAALTALGVAPVAIPRAETREPIWPHGIVGSITHTKGLCFAALARKETTLALGVDAEPAVALSDRVRPAILIYPDEQGVGPVEATVVFSAKEAVYKALSPWLDEIWGFDALRIELDGNGQSFVAHLNRPAGALAVGDRLVGIALQDEHHVVTGLSLSRSG